MNDIDICYQGVKQGDGKDAEENDDGLKNPAFQHEPWEKEVVEGIDEEEMSGHKTQVGSKDTQGVFGDMKYKEKEYRNTDPEENMHQHPLPGNPIQEFYIHEFGHGGYLQPMY